jgi:hypothetical protein
MACSCGERSWMKRQTRVEDIATTGLHPHHLL